MKIIQSITKFTNDRAFKALLWSVGGTCFYHLCRWLINISVVRLSTDFVDAGILILAVSITSIWQNIAIFHMRNIQVSDVKSEFSDSDYISSRFFTVIIGIIFCIIHAFIFTRNIYQTTVIFLYMLIVASTCFADVFHGILQKHWRMDKIGISYIIKGIGTLILFILLFYYFGLLYAVLGMVIFSVFIFFIYDINAAKKYTTFKLSLKIKKILPLYIICLPLVIVAFLYSIIPAVTRMVLEKHIGIEMLGIYGSVTLPATIIQMVTYSAFAPFTNVFTHNIHEKKYSRFIFIFCLGILSISILFIIFYIFTFIFGEWLIGFLFGNEIIKYTYLFREAVIFCFLSSIFTFSTLPLVIFRLTKTIMFINIIGIIIFTLTINPFIKYYGLSGANYVQILSFGFIALITFSICLIISKKRILISNSDMMNNE